MYYKLLFMVLYWYLTSDWKTLTIEELILELLNNNYYHNFNETLFLSPFVNLRSVGLLYMEYLSVEFWSKATILIGCDKTCDIRIIDDIIVYCQQGQSIQQV